MQITAVQTDSEFDDLRPIWEALVERDPLASVFQTFDWQRTWWHHYRGDRRLYILLAREAGEVVAILPLYRMKRPLRGLGHADGLLLIGHGGDTTPDYLGAVALPEFAELAAQGFVQHLLAIADWHVIEIADMRHESPLLARLRDSKLRFGMSRDVAESAKIFYINLPKSWEAYLATLTHNQRSQFRHARKRFLELPGARLYLSEDPAELPRLIDALIDLHHQRWKGKGEKHAFASAQYVSFHRELMQRFMERGWLRMYCMELKGRLIAVDYCYAFRDTHYAFQCGFDPEFSKLSPGNCLLGYAIQRAIEEGRAVFDLLRGEHDYKKRWAREVRVTHSVWIYRPSVPAVLHRLLRRVLPGLKQSLRVHLSR